MKLVYKLQAEEYRHEFPVSYLPVSVWKGGDMRGTLNSVQSLAVLIPCMEILLGYELSELLFNSPHLPFSQPPFGHPAQCHLAEVVMPVVLGAEVAARGLQQPRPAAAAPGPLFQRWHSHRG